jgi:hypothetical protein
MFLFCALGHNTIDFAEIQSSFCQTSLAYLYIRYMSRTCENEDKNLRSESLVIRVLVLLVERSHIKIACSKVTVGKHIIHICLSYILLIHSETILNEHGQILSSQVQVFWCLLFQEYLKMNRALSIKRFWYQASLKSQIIPPL